MNEYKYKQPSTTNAVQWQSKHLWIYFAIYIDCATPRYNNTYVIPITTFVNDICTWCSNPIDIYDSACCLWLLWCWLQRWRRDTWQERFGWNTYTVLKCIRVDWMHNVGANDIVGECITRYIYIENLCWRLFLRKLYWQSQHKNTLILARDIMDKADYLIAFVAQ